MGASKPVRFLTGTAPFHLFFFEAHWLSQIFTMSRRLALLAVADAMQVRLATNCAKYRRLMRLFQKNVSNLTADDDASSS